MKFIEKVENVKKELKSFNGGLKLGEVREDVVNNVGRGGSWYKVVVIEVKEKREGKEEKEKRLKEYLVKKVGIEESRIVFWYW